MKETVTIPSDERLDQLACKMLEHPQVEQDIVHTFTKGLYSRRFVMPENTLWISAKHKTEHQYAILQGVVSVYSDSDGVVLLSAPHNGITKPGTQRMLYAHSLCVWITFHATDKTTPEEVWDEIIEPSSKVIEYLKQKEATCPTHWPAQQLSEA